MSDSKRQYKEMTLSQRELGNIPGLRERYFMEDIARRYISEILQSQSSYSLSLFKDRDNQLNEKAFYLLSLALRYSSNPAREVLNLIEEIKQIIPSNDDERLAIHALIANSTRALESFERWGCQIPRFADEAQMADISRSYSGSKEEINFPNEMLYGEQSFKAAEEALKFSQHPETFQPPVPSDPVEKFMQDAQLKALKEVDGEKQSGMRAALHYLMEDHYKIATKRIIDATKKVNAEYEKQNDDEKEKTYQRWKQARESAHEMRILRHNPNAGRFDYGPKTAMTGRYGWARPLATEISRLAKISKMKDCETTDSGEYPRPGYVLTYNYNGQKYYLTSVAMTGGLRDERLRYLTDENTAVWNHGQTALRELWPRLRELHEEVMNFPLDRSRPPNNNRENLLAFYDKLIELIWLMGNMTPVHRGTAKTVEQWFAMAHLQHGLRTPILKIENPQLDVLNLTMPLSEYKRLFFKFFESESLPQPIREMTASPDATPATYKKQ